MSFFVALFAQKNSIEIGMTAFNHFDGYGFKVSRGVTTSYRVALQILESISLGYDRHIDKKNAFSISFNSFNYIYQINNGLRNRGVYQRNMLNLNFLYKRQLLQLLNERISISATSGIAYRAGSDGYFWGYIIIDGINPQKKAIEESLIVNDIGTLVGASIRMKIYKELFVDVQGNYSYYLIGRDLNRSYDGIKRTRQVFYSTLSLGYRF
jgi:hypothetical protein